MKSRALFTLRKHEGVSLLGHRLEVGGGEIGTERSEELLVGPNSERRAIFGRPREESHAGIGIGHRNERGEQNE